MIGYRALASAAAALWLVPQVLHPSEGERAPKPNPNILIITADNLGYGDLRAFNPDSKILTPNLDRLAGEGAILTDFYTASPTCTVSRACLLTGRIAERHGLKNQLPGIAGNYGRGLNPKEILIPQIVKKAGYTTACFGKWNIGFAPGSRPTERGFDTFFGHASGNIDYETHVYNGKHDLFDGTVEAHVKGYATDLFAAAASQFIARHHEKPWFVYLPFNAPHFPNPKNKAPGVATIWQAPDSAFAAYSYDPKTEDPTKRYRAVVTALDSGIGTVLETLDDLGIADNTFVFFFSDNGAFMLKDRGLEVASNAPLRDGGITCWEGGIRVPAIARWPGKIAPDSKIAEPLWSPDLLIAAAQLSGTKPPGDIKLDGKDPLPTLTTRAVSPHRSLFFTYQKHAALRMGAWKIVRTKPDAGWRLFNLREGIAESADLASVKPDQLETLTAEFGRWQKSFRP